MDQIDVDFCFYDDPDYCRDADRDSRKLRRWHQLLWSKDLPDDRRIEWTLERGTSCLVFGDLRASSDTIATTHSNYRRAGMARLYEGLTQAEQKKYERAFYTIGGFIIFPTRPQSLNQRRGNSTAIADRFDLTLECIRQHYLGCATNPLSDVLSSDADYFRLFGVGREGFQNFIEFFHLQDLASADSVRWLDDHAGEWQFDRHPLPATPDLYRRYLDNVAKFVAARNGRIHDWCNSPASLGHSGGGNP